MTRKYEDASGAVKLSGADLSSANIDGAEFRSVLYSETTRFPPGFVLDPSCFQKEAPWSVKATGRRKAMVCRASEDAQLLFF